jgi:hypothetical protein
MRTELLPACDSHHDRSHSQLQLLSCKLDWKLLLCCHAAAELHNARGTRHAECPLSNVLAADAPVRLWGLGQLFPD